MSTVLIADDHPIVAHGIERLLSHADDLEVIAACYSGRETVAMASRTRPDLVLLDVRLGDLNGSDVCRQLATVAPSARVVMLTAYDDAENLRRCLEAGAAGVLLKGTLDLDLVQALRDVRDGRMVIDGSVARSLETAQDLLDEADTTYAQLRPREIDVLRLMVAGLTTKDIAAELELTINTIRSYTQALMEKLGAHTRVQAIVFAQKRHLIRCRHLRQQRVGGLRCGKAASQQLAPSASKWQVPSPERFYSNRWTQGHGEQARSG